MRKERKIRLSLDQVSVFVNAAERCDFPVDVRGEGKRRYSADAKSVIGVMTLDLADPLIVSYSGYNEKFEELLGRLAS